MLQGVITVDIGICIDHNGIRGHGLVGILEQIGIGQTFPNQFLLHLMPVFAAAPLVSKILFVQEDDLVDQGIGHVVLQAFTDLFLALGNTVDKILRKKPDLWRDGIDIGYLNVKGTQLFLAMLWQWQRIRLENKSIKMKHQTNAGHGIGYRSIPRLSYNRELHRELFENADADLESDPVCPRELLEDSLGDEQGYLVLLEDGEVFWRSREQNQGDHRNGVLPFEIVGDRRGHTHIDAGLCLGNGWMEPEECTFVFLANRTTIDNGGNLGTIHGTNLYRNEGTI